MTQILLRNVKYCYHKQLQIFSTNIVKTNEYSYYVQILLSHTNTKHKNIHYCHDIQTNSNIMTMSPKALNCFAYDIMLL